MPRIKDSLEILGSRFASSTISLQIDVIVTGAIAELEVEILSKIDKLTHGAKGIGRDDPIAIWACLWILILCYQEEMIYEKAFLHEGSYSAFNATRQFVS